MSKTLSPKYSLKGWTFKQWLLGNEKTIIELVKIGVPYLISIYATNDVALSALITGFGKLLLDALHYYLKEQKV